MPDISMCWNKECPKKLKCYRFTAIPNEFRQTFADFKPDEEGVCDHFWDNQGRAINPEYKDLSHENESRRD